MPTELQRRAIVALLRAGWTRGEISIVLEIPVSILESVVLPKGAPDYPPATPLEQRSNTFP